MPGPVLTADSSGTGRRHEGKEATRVSGDQSLPPSYRRNGQQEQRPRNPQTNATHQLYQLKTLLTGTRGCSAWPGAWPTGQQTTVRSLPCGWPTRRPLRRGAPGGHPGVGTGTLPPPRTGVNGGGHPCTDGLWTSSLNRAHPRLAAAGETGPENLVGYREKPTSTERARSCTDGHLSKTARPARHRGPQGPAPSAASRFPGPRRALADPAGLGGAEW